MSTSEPFHISQANSGYDQGAFNRLQSLRALGPEGVRRLTEHVLWRSLTPEDQLEYIDEAIAVIGLGEHAQERQDDHISMRLVTAYLLSSGDPKNHYHPVGVRPSTQGEANASDDGVSGLPPVA